MDSTHVYEVRAKSTRLRSGVVASDAVHEPLKFSAPPEFLGEPGVWTPEHFFVAAVVTCFVSTFSGMADLSKLNFVSLEVAAEAVLEKDATGWRFTAVKLRPDLKIGREHDRERAIRLLEKAERNCLVARSISAQVSLEPVVTVVAEPVPVGPST
ncbi:MAG TPA: OsmC family protein [Verrucomicrobiae bacterium]|nr:OsmC family protein [Verrucomicrobiae bacterium]